MNPVINKFAVAIVTVIAELAVVINGGLNEQEIILLILSFAGALGVYAIPNAAKGVAR